MFEKTGILLFYTETSLHMGTGSAISYVDLPIEREKHTGYPVMPATGIKGVLRDLARRKWNKERLETIFGPEVKEEPEKFSSCITFTDGRILLLPVRSLKGVFAWVTCPFVLQRLKKDAEVAKIHTNLPSDDLVVGEEEALVVPGNDVTHKQKLLLEEYQFNAEEKEKAKQIAEELLKFLNKFPSQNISKLLETLPKRLAVISDNAFSEMSEVAMEVSTRIRIDYKTGTVEEGALFTEEAVPSESIFYSLVFLTSPFKKEDEIKSAADVMREIKELVGSCSLLQFGGDASVGRGLVRVAVVEGGEKS